MCCKTHKRNTLPENRGGSPQDLTIRADRKPVGPLPIAVITGCRATTQRRPPRPASEECPSCSQQQCRRNPDRRPISCEPPPTSAFTAGRRVAVRRLD